MTDDQPPCAGTAPLAEGGERSGAESALEGFSAHVVETEMLRLVMLPQLGAKIVSLQDLRTKREWLWRSDRLPLMTVPYGADYGATGDTGGWDECFPTVAPCAYPGAPYSGLHLPDHGELWNRPWDVGRTETADAIVLAGTCRGVALPYIFRRSLRIARREARITAVYELVNTGASALRFIWSAHPLFALEPGMRLELRPDVPLMVDSQTPDRILGRETRWPPRFHLPAGALCADPLPGPDAALAVKLWSAPAADLQARLIAADGAMILTHPPGAPGQIGIWLNAGGWSGSGGPPLYNLGLEPCWGPGDSLEAAVAAGQPVGGVAPLGRRAWSFDIELEAWG